MADERVAAVDGEVVESDDESEVHVNAAIADPEHPEEMMPAMHVCADELASGDLDELQAIRKVRVELEQLQEAIRQDELAPVSAGVPKKRIHALQRATQAMIDRSVAQKIEAAARSVEEAEKGSVVQNVSEFIEAYAQGTGSKPLSMYGPEMWAMCFPHLFPYGDGVFGLPRSEPLTFQQCSVMHLLREELVYQVDKEAVRDADNAFGPGIALGDSDARPASHSSCKCKHCQDSCCLYVCPEQPRWGADRDLLCCYYDSWRRMQQIRKARGHVTRAGFKERLECICRASAEKIDEAIAALGPGASVKDVLRGPEVDKDVKVALSELMVFTSEVIGSDGARAKLRHEQNGYALMFGPAGGFLTPNLADTRSPIVVHLHGAGGEEEYVVDLLSEEPAMPSRRKMLEIIAKDPVAQARFFILSMRLFCEHVLGTGPFDAWLRHNGYADNVVFPDGFAASGLGGAFGMLAALFGPIEEQARLSIHPHILLWFVHTQSEQWLRRILRKDSEEARELLRGWQEKVLAAVQSMQLDSAAVLPLLLAESPEDAEEPRNTPFSARQQQDCRMDGGEEDDVRDPGKRRPALATEDLFVDHHFQRHVASLPAGEEPMSTYLLPQTGAQVCLLPHYRLLRATTQDDLSTEEGSKAEAIEYGRRYAEDYRLNISEGQMHAHKDTCFKYVVDKGVRFAKHCRFHFCHFVTPLFPGRQDDAWDASFGRIILAAWHPSVDGEDRSTVKLFVQVLIGDKRVEREVTFARTGKDLVLPRSPGDEEPSLFPTNSAGEIIPLTPTKKLGPKVVDDPDHGKDCLVVPIRWNPLEGSSNGPAQVAIRGNVDYQSMVRTLKYGYCGMRDELRSAPLSPEEQAALDEQDDADFEAALPSKINAILDAKRRRSRGKTEAELEEQLRAARARRRATSRRGGSAARKFASQVKSLVVEGMKNSMQSMFYACDYSTKPNMTCAPLLVAVQQGIQRLEEYLRLEEEKAPQEEILAASPGKKSQPAAGDQAPRKRRPLTKLEDEARRRLIRQASAANQAIVKGNCLMVMQMLTGREALRTQPWIYASACLEAHGPY